MTVKTIQGNAKVIRVKPKVLVKSTALMGYDGRRIISYLLFSKQYVLRG